MAEGDLNFGPEFEIESITEDITPEEAVEILKRLNPDKELDYKFSNGFKTRELTISPESAKNDVEMRLITLPKLEDSEITGVYEIDHEPGYELHKIQFSKDVYDRYVNFFESMWKVAKK